MQTIIFGGGCFWCTEAVFQRLKGVESVMPGYVGGRTDNPTYEDVSSGGTEHTEVIKVGFNPDQISLQDLLSVFFTTHDPTTLNQQGADVGTQYRSAIYYTDDSQKQEVEKFILNLEQEKVFDKAITTEVRPLEKFYEAEKYHQDFYNRNQEYPYCQAVINPKISKLRQKYSKLLKDQ